VKDKSREIKSNRALSKEGSPMKRKWTRTLTALAAAGLLLVLPLTGSAAGIVDLTKPCSLTVYSAGTENAELTEDLEEADVVVDLYRVAAAVENKGYDGYTYQMLSPFLELKVEKDITQDGWKALAKSAANIALQQESQVVPVVEGADAGVRITTDQDGRALTPGLYLAVARGAEVEDYVVTIEEEGGSSYLATVAYSDTYQYTFAPQLVSLPGKDADQNGAASSANPTEWLYDFGVYLKPEQDLRSGSLEIVKELLTYETSDTAIFVFDVKAEREGRTVYSNVVSLSFTEPGQKHVLIDNLPVGAEVTVTEVYSGSSYRLVTPAVGTATITAAEIASVTFVNDYDERQNGGHGITNHFAYDADNGWEWTQMADNAAE